MKKSPAASDNPQFVIIGGGPAGLTAAYELTRHDFQPIVLEKLDKVGGIARTEAYKGYRFDMGGHRFFTKSTAVNQFWREILGDDFLRRPRLSRIFYKQKFFNYPLKPFNALAGLGPWESVLIIASYLRWQLFPHPVEETFEQWVTNRFGKRLFETFFKSYTEKVWGISTSELKAEWAAQRIKDLSLRTAITSMFLKPGTSIKTLIEEFDYPRRGPGMLWTAVAEKIEMRGGQVLLNSEVIGIEREGMQITGVQVARNGRVHTIPGTHFISSMPITQFIQALTPPPPTHVLNAASHLSYRDFLTVCLIIDKPDLFPDNWIYIHDPNVHVGRIQNFKNWSHEMVPDPTKTSLGLEYFCNEGDEFWNMPDEDLIALASRELDQIGLARPEDVLDGTVFRVEKSYPVYDSDYAQHLDTIKAYMAELENVQTIGRNGLHRYNNQDHAMLTGMLAVRNVLFGEQNNLWLVNAEQDYHEEVAVLDDVPLEEVIEAVEEAWVYVFPKLDMLAFGMALGVVLGIALGVLTLWTAMVGNTAVITWMELLGQYFPGYHVSTGGSLVGLFYGFLCGFGAGGFFAFVRNAVTAVYVATTFRSAERNALETFFDHI